MCSSSECPQIQCNKTALRFGHYVICGHYKRLIGCYVDTTYLLVTIVPCVEEGRGGKSTFVGDLGPL